MLVSMLSALWQQLREWSHVCFPCWKSTPRSPPNVSSAWLSQLSSAQLTGAGTKRDLMKCELRFLFFRGDAVSSTRFFRSISRFLFCFQSAGWTTGHSSGILVICFGFQGPKHKGVLINSKNKAKIPQTPAGNQGFTFRLDFYRCAYTQKCK